MDEALVRRITRLERKLAGLVMPAVGQGVPHWLKTPLTSTSWDGDSFSTTAKTALDLSAVFGAPDNLRAALFRVTIRDSGSAANDCYLILSPNNTAGQGPTVRCSGLANDSWTTVMLVVPCDSGGDVYYQIAASGSSTLEANVQIWGYWL